MIEPSTPDLPPACDLIDQYVDGLLSETERARVLEHLEQCRACRAIVRQQQLLEQSVRQYADQLVPPFSITVNHQSGRRVLPWLALATAASVLAVLFFDWPDNGASIAKPRLAPSDESAEVQTQTPTSGPQIRSLTSSSHLAVIEPSNQDGITFVMLYPKVDLEEEN
ncbi:MAG: zf-HC2 domain-containing protein [Pirellulales bacterium]|nr:zf-HC2 domain-containing protein [Pirellulales bacterium]